MALPSHAADWMSRAEIDYIGPFVKAWAAFNAWYRHVSGEAREREMLEYVKSQPNPVRQNILPLLDNDNPTGDALALKLAIHNLHQYLDAIRLEVRKKGVNERISFRTVCLRPKDLQNEQTEHRGHVFEAIRVKNGAGAIKITIRSQHTGKVKFDHTQAQYDPNEIYALSDFRKLSGDQRDKLRQFYDGCNPRPPCDLVRGDGPELTIGTTKFHCTDEDLLSGLIETIYAMRNALLHGEVEPAKTVLDCYEPAYRIVMQFLAGIQ